MNEYRTIAGEANDMFVERRSRFIGYAKPVPVNPYRLRERKKGMLLVSLAGPATNLILALIAGRAAKALIDLVVRKNALYYAVYFLIIFTQKIFASLLPDRWEAAFYRYQKYFYIVVLVLYLLGVLNVIIDPVISFLYRLIIS